MSDEKIATKRDIAQGFSKMMREILEKNQAYLAKAVAAESNQTVAGRLPKVGEGGPNPTTRSISEPPVKGSVLPSDKPARVVDSSGSGSDPKLAKQMLHGTIAGTARRTPIKLPGMTPPIKAATKSPKSTPPPIPAAAKKLNKDALAHNDPARKTNLPSMGGFKSIASSPTKLPHFPGMTKKAEKPATAKPATAKPATAKPAMAKPVKAISAPKSAAKPPKGPPSPKVMPASASNNAIKKAK